MQPRASFAYDSARTLAVRAATFATAFVNGIVVARWLGPEGVGILALLSLVHRLALRLGSLGFGHAFAYFVARGEASALELTRVLWWVSGGMSLLTAVLLLAFRPTLWGDIDASLFAVALLTIPGALLTNAFQRLFGGQLRIAEVNASTLLAAAAQTALTVIWVAWLEWGVAGALLALIASELAGVLLLALRQWLDPERGTGSASQERPERRPTQLASELWKYGRWTYAQMLTALLVDEIPLMLVKAVSGDNAVVGLFNRARGLARYPQMVVTPLSNVLFSYTAASESERAVQRTNLLCRGSLPLLALGLFAVSFVIGPIIELLYGADFLAAVPIFYACAPGILVFPIAVALGTHMAASGSPREVFTGNVWVLLLGTAIAIPLVWLEPGVGAGLGLSALYLTLFFVRLYQYARLSGVSWRDVLVLRRRDLARLRSLAPGYSR